MLRFALVLSLVLFSCVRSNAADPPVLGLGVVDSLFKGLEAGKRKVLENDFTTMVNEFTGLKAEFRQGADLSTATKNLAAGTWHIGVMQGVEFAWARSKDPKIKAILVASNKQHKLHAILLTKKDDPAKGFADLKGKDVNLLAPTREHCRLFADKGAGGKAKDFFGKLVEERSGESALDDILLGKVQAAIVDNIALENYKEINPGRFNRLKIVAKSEPFPEPVLVYYEGNLSEGLLKKFSSGLIKANKSAKARDFMDIINIAALEPVPENHARLLADIVKAYPPPK